MAKFYRIQGGVPSTLRREYAPGRDPDRGHIRSHLAASSGSSSSP